MTFDDELFRAICDLTREAGNIALGFFNHGLPTSAEIAYKHGNSPVTIADKMADNFLRRKLGDLLPAAAWLSEETADSPARLSSRQVFIVDPIDGTRAFMSGDPRWAVSVALVEDGLPTMAVLHAPALGRTYTAVRGHGAWCNNAMLQVKAQPLLSGGLFAGPKPFSDQLHRHGHMVELVPKIPSLALRFADVAAGKLDAACASADAHEWDIAAVDLILHEAGGCIVDSAGGTLHYNRVKLTHGVLLASPKSLVAILVKAAKEAGI